MIPNLVIVALEFYREPRRLFYLRDPQTPLPSGITELLAAPANELADENIAQTAAALNATVEECREIVPFFIKQVLLDCGGDYYRTLGLPRDADTELVKRHYHYLIRLFHPDRDVRDDNWDELYAPRINEAYSTLRNPGKRQAYDASLNRAVNDGFSSLLNQYMQQQPKIHKGTQQFTPPPPSQPPPPQPPLAPQRTAKGSALSPLAKKVAAGLTVAVVLSFALVVTMQSQQPTLRVEAQLNPGQTEKNQPSAKKLRDSTHSASTLAQRQPDKSTTTNKISTDASDDNTDRPGAISSNQVTTEPSMRPLSVEEQIKAQVERATVAVIGHSPAAAKKRPVKKKVKVQAAAPVVEQPVPIEVVSSSPAEHTVKEVAVVEKIAEELPAPKLAVTEKTTEQQAYGVEESDERAKERATAEAVSVQRPAQQTAQLEVTEPDAAIAQPPTLSLEELHQLLDAMVSNYESGSLQGFVSLFSEHARTTDANGRDAIYKIYKPYFARPEQREMKISQFLWKNKGADASSGLGEVYMVNTPINGGAAVKGGGTLQLDVERFSEGLKITGMFYKTSKR